MISLKSACRLVLLLAMLSATLSLSRAENMVIIASTGTSDKLQPGQVLNSATPLKMPSGVSITLLSQSGKIVKIEGPFAARIQAGENNETQKATRKWSDTVALLAKAVSKDVDKTIVTGSSRGKIGWGDDDNQPAFWLLAVDSSGHRCVQSKGAQLWRKDAQRSVEMDLRSEKASAKGLVWDAGKQSVPLPSQFVEDSVLIVMKIDTQPRRFNLHVLPETIGATEWGRVLTWMIDSKCERQALLLISGLHDGKLSLK